MNRNPLRHWTLIAVMAAGAALAPVLRLLEVTGAAHPDLGDVGQPLLFGLAIMAADLAVLNPNLVKVQQPS